jgi:hypothetical protein
MTRRKLLVVLGPAAVLMVIGALASRPDPITDKTFGRIKVGMSRAEVHALLGSPADYRTIGTEADIWGPTVGDWLSAGIIGGNGALEENWEFDVGDIRVKYTETGVVRAGMYFCACKLERSLLDDLLWRAKRQWHRWFPEERRSTGWMRGPQPQF